MFKLNVEIDAWPRCYYNQELRCGDPKTRLLGRPQDAPYNENIVDRGWHIMDMCDCPSCPLRCAIRDAKDKYEKMI